MTGILDENLRGMATWLKDNVTERNCIFLLVALFIILSVFVVAEPYDPLYRDKADASTNVIWTENYSQGVHHIPFDEWEFGPTQSVVIEYNGEYTVVNEKGPGHAMMLVPFHIMGVEAMFGLLMALLATIATCMLGKRLFNWRVGFIASALVLTNATVIVMWHRYYWTDASTMHLFILSFWLLIEANYRFNGCSLALGNCSGTDTKQKLIALGIGTLSGLAFGASVSTRYPTAILVIAFLVYLKIFYLIRAWPDFKRRDLIASFKKTAGFWLLLLAFIIGLLCVLYPLMQYNSEYFGGPFASGYDATPLSSFDPIEGISARNTTTTWTSGLGEGLANAANNFIILLPILIARIPILVFAPLGILFLRKKPILIVLLLIIAVNFYTYMSLAWVDMYARLDMFRILWEPRYFMPALPVITILGAVGIDGLVKWRRDKPREMVGNPKPVRRETRMIAGAFIVVCILLLLGLAPVSNYFMTDGAEGRPPGPGPGDMEVHVVTTDQLFTDFFELDNRFVRVENAEIINIDRGMPFVRSPDAQDSRGIPVQFRDWPPGTVPQFEVGQTATVQGLFMTLFTPEGPRPIINVKYGTEDYFTILPQRPI